MLPKQCSRREEVEGLLETYCQNSERGRDIDTLILKCCVQTCCDFRSELLFVAPQAHHGSQGEQAEETRGTEDRGAPYSLGFLVSKSPMLHAVQKSSFLIVPLLVVDNMYGRSLSS